MPTTTHDAGLRALRAQFPVLERRAYLYAGALAPLSTAVHEALIGGMEAWLADPLGTYDAIPGEILATKRAFADLVGADEAAVFLTDNTSRAANLIVAAISQRNGTNVVTDATTYPSASYAWMAMTPLEVRGVAPGAKDLTDDIASRIDDDTVAVSVSHISPTTGFRHDLPALAEVAHEHGALLVVDAAQSAGVVSLDVVRDRVDALVTTAMKWMLGPPGVGLGALRPDLLKTAPLNQIGYAGVDLPDDEFWPRTTLPPLAPTGRRLELGMPASGLLAGVRAGIRALLDVGVDVIEARVAELVDVCIDGLHTCGITVRTPDRRSRRGGVIAVEHPEAVALAEFLRRHGVDIGGYRYGVARIDPHAYNTFDDVNRFLTGVEQFQRGAR